MIVTRRILVTGRVQGVSFRAFVMHHAKELGLHGFVRNRRDGTVEAVAVGQEEQVSALIAACRKGPPASRVERVETGETEAFEGKGFHQLPTI